MIFKPAPCSTRWEGAAAIVWIIMIDLLVVVWAARRASDPLKFLLLLVLVLSLPLLVHLLFRTWAAFSLEYWVDRNAVTVRWANVRTIIPIQTITRIVERVELPPNGPHPLAWPAPHLRTVRTEQGGSLQFLATRSPSECLMLETDLAVYALSPVDRRAFVEAVQERYRLGPTQVLSPAQIRYAWWNRFLPDDALGSWLLVLGFVGVVVLFGVLLVSFPNLPEVLAVRYNSTGVPEEVQQKSALFRLPIIGMLAWMLNGVFGMGMMARGQRTGAYMLWGGAIVVEIVSLFALISLIS